MEFSKKTVFFLLVIVVVISFVSTIYVFSVIYPGASSAPSPSQQQPSEGPRQTIVSNGVSVGYVTFESLNKRNSEEVVPGE